MVKINAEMAEALERAEQSGHLKDEGIGIDFYRAWEVSRKTGNERINFYELCHDEAYIVKDMRRAGISEFTVSERSTALLTIAQRLEELGCKLVGLAMVEQEPVIWMRKGTEVQPIPALLFKIM